MVDSVGALDMARRINEVILGLDALDPIKSATAAAGETAKILDLGSKEKLVVKDVAKDADGTTHTRYERTYGAAKKTDALHPAIDGAAIALRAAAAEVTGAFVVGTARSALLARDTVERPSLTCTTRSPPRTGRPAYGGHGQRCGVSASG